MLFNNALDMGRQLDQLIEVTGGFAARPAALRVAAG
jgi:hypothetical protein